MRRLATGFFVVGLPISALAQDVPYTPEAVDACLAGADSGASRQDCIDASANACIEALPDLISHDIVACLDSALEDWEMRRVSALADVVKAETAAHAQDGAPAWDLGGTLELLGERTTVWEAWRDAACAYEESNWRGGTGGSAGYLDCMMRMTGREALELESRAGALRQ